MLDAEHWYCLGCRDDLKAEGKLVTVMSVNTYCVYPSPIAMHRRKRCKSLVRLDGCNSCGKLELPFLIVNRVKLSTGRMFAQFLSTV